MRKDELYLMNQHYSDLFKKFGDTEKSVGWNKPKQFERFQIIFQMIYKALSRDDRKQISVLDLGCGLGHFYEEIRRRGHDWSYTGIDINQTFIKECKKKFPEANFITSLINAENICDADIIIASGLFNRKLEKNNEFIEQIFRASLEKTNLILCFNFLHVGAIKKYDNNYYTSLAIIENLIDRSQVSGWEIDGLSLPGEFTIGCHK